LKDKIEKLNKLDLKRKNSKFEIKPSKMVVDFKRRASKLVPNLQDLHPPEQKPSLRSPVKIRTNSF
jgi:hypothetical protein